MRSPHSPACCPGALPLLRRGGSIVALKGSSAPDEVDAAASDLRRLGLTARASQVTTHEGAEPTWLIVCT